MHAARTMTKGAPADPLAMFLRLCNPDPDMASAAGELTPFAAPALPLAFSSLSSSSSHGPAWIRPAARRVGADDAPARRRAAAPAPMPTAIDPPLAAEWDAFVAGTTPSSSSSMSSPTPRARDAALVQWAHFQSSFDTLSDPMSCSGADNTAPLQFAPPGTSLDDAYGAVLNTVTRSASDLDAAWHKSPPVDCADASWRRNRRARVAPDRAAEMARAGKMRLAMLARHLGAGRTPTATASAVEIKHHKDTKEVVIAADDAPASRTNVAAAAYDACMAHQSVQLSPSF
ncbi:hypothetical protein GGF31_007388 [Allomyces arbusculus]|nr:hypothetical protein GGF31_007388 [Allomyces arbusculus]